MRKKRNGGRDPQLLAARNAKILERFIYWTEEQSMRSDRAITLMSQQEFFLTEQTILKVLNEAYSRDGKKVQVVFHQPKPPKLTQEQKELLKKG
ncbi:MAG: hypothetical protein E7112_00890 [Bacteroidales bacterium]|nr:hypothetical protein [Bacteroidales bacterium]